MFLFDTTILPESMNMGLSLNMECGESLHSKLSSSELLMLLLLVLFKFVKLAWSLEFDLFRVRSVARVRVGLGKGWGLEMA